MRQSNLISLMRFNPTPVTPLVSEKVGNDNIYTFNQGDGGKVIKLAYASRNNTLKFGKGITPGMLVFEKSPDSSVLLPKIKITVRYSESDDSVSFTESLNSRFMGSSSFKNIEVNGQVIPLAKVRAAIYKNEQPVLLEKKPAPDTNYNVLDIIEIADNSALQVMGLSDAIMSFDSNTENYVASSYRDLPLISHVPLQLTIPQ